MIILLKSLRVGQRFNWIPAESYGPYKLIAKTKCSWHGLGAFAIKFKDKYGIILDEWSAFAYTKILLIILRSV